MNIIPPMPALRATVVLIFLCVEMWIAPASSLYAQTRRAYEIAGDAAVESKDYAAALQHYTIALGKSSRHSIDLEWKYAECARQIFSLDIAEKAYQNLSKQPEALKKHPLIWLRLGEVHQLKGDYATAVADFDRFLAAATPAQRPFVEQATAARNECQWASEHTTDSSRVQVKLLDKKINSPYSDFGAIAIGDTMYYSSYRFEQKNSKTTPKARQTRPMISVKGKLSREPNRSFLPVPDSVHVAHLTFTPSREHAIFTRCKNQNAQDIRCELWITSQDIKGRWSKPVRLPEPINQSGFTTTHPSIGVVPSTGEMYMWFASDRPGGAGKLDLWAMPLDTNWFCPCNAAIDARKPNKLPKFAEAKPISTLNTPDDDATPHYAPATGTLYFSSKGWPGYGGYDIFRSSLTDSAGYAAPVNAGSGLNTSYNDLYFWLRPDGKSGYMSSNRPGTMYLDAASKSCCNDIFEVQYPTPTPPVIVKKTNEPPVGLVAKKVDVPTVTSVPKPVVPPLVPEEPKLTDFVGLPLYFDNDEPDKRTRKTVTLKTYEETVTAYLDRQEEYRERYSNGLTTNAMIDAQSSVDAFFDLEVRQGFDRLSSLCDLLQEQLDSGLEVEILIKGYTSPRAQSDYNLNLGRRRISSVRNHIMRWNGSALEPFFKNGQLKVTETSYGESTVAAGVSDDISDERQSIYDPRAARERRVEIVGIKAKRK
jgi:outer membrane protein OmpA-like peptidoglycan-associated protein